MLSELKAAYEAAIQQQARLRNRPISEFDKLVAESIFTAGLLAIEDGDCDVAQYRVVSAPTGSGKSSYAQAFSKAIIETYPEGSVLFLVETIQQADDTFHDLLSLVGLKNVAVWTSAHDRQKAADVIKSQYGFVPPRRFAVEDLNRYPIVVATHNFYMGSRGDSTAAFRDNVRKITFIDEKVAEVSIFDVDTGLIKTVRDRLAEKYSSDNQHVEQLTALHQHLENIWQAASRKAAFDQILDVDDADLSWFRSEQANNYITSLDDQVKHVFGFGRALANGFAFLSRYDDYGKGARFVGYEMRMPLRPGTILLDATADIDGVSLLVNNRQHVRVPRVDFRNLTITHIEPDLLKGQTVSQIVKQAARARPYAEWILRIVRENSRKGEHVLVVVHKAMLDHEYLPRDHREFSRPFDLDGRHVSFINWGSGIGSNRWKNATAVFLFGEFHVPKRTMVGTTLGLQERRATSDALAPFQSPNPNSSGLTGIREGHLGRWMKQLAMRGNARNIDESGVCGEQRLYLTGELERLIVEKERMFPGSKLILSRRQNQLKLRGVAGLVSVLYASSAQEITTKEIRQLIGPSFQKNKKRYLSDPVVECAMRDTGFDFQEGGGRGKSGKFVRTSRPI